MEGVEWVSWVRPGFWGVGSTVRAALGAMQTSGLSSWGHLHMRPFLTRHSLAKVFQWSKIWIEILTSDVWGIRGVCKPTISLIQMCVCVRACFSGERVHGFPYSISGLTASINWTTLKGCVPSLKRKEGHVWHRPTHCSPHTPAPCVVSVRWCSLCNSVSSSVQRCAVWRRAGSRHRCYLNLGSWGCPRQPWSDTDLSDRASPHSLRRPMLMCRCTVSCLS